MSLPLRRLAAVTAAVVSAGLLAPLLPATPAAAADVSTEVAIVQSDDIGGDFAAGYYRRTPPSGASTALVPELGNLDRLWLDVSRDGSRFIYLEDTYDGAGDLVRSKVIVRDISGRLVRVLQDLPATSPHYSSNPILSPDGNTAVWTNEDYTSGEPIFSIRKVAVAAGSPVSIPGSRGFGSGTFLDATTLAVGDDTSEKSLPLAGGTPAAIPGDTEPAYNFTVSPDGSRIAWTFDKTPLDSDIRTTDIQVATLTLSGGGASFGPPTTVATGGYNRHPAWSRDGSTLYFIKMDNDVDGDGTGTVGPGDVWSVPADASAAPVTSRETPGDDYNVGIGATDDVAPGAATASQPFTLSGTSATVRWALPGDTDLSGVSIVRTQTDNGATTTRFVPAPLTSVLDTGLTVGKTYSYAITSVDRSGNTGSAAVRSLTAVGALATFADPTSTTSTRPPFLVRFAAAAPPSVLFTVDFTINGGGYRSWVAAKSGPARTFGVASAGANATASVPGQVYRFRVSATDSFGNTTGQVLSGKAVVPFDQATATLSGGVNVARADAWFGTVRALTAAGQFARIGVTGDRFQVIGERCPTCGIVDVFDGSTRIASVDTRAAARTPRAVLFTKAWPTVGYHVLTLKPRGTAGRPNVVLDGFAVRR